jgi:magnesium transporter
VKTNPTESETRTSSAEAQAAVVQRITHNTKNRTEAFLHLPLAQQSVVLRDSSPHIQQILLDETPLEQAVTILDYLDLRTAQQLLCRLSEPTKRRKIISRLKNERHQKIEQFVQFHPKANSNLLHLHYLLLPHTATVHDAATALEDYINTTGKIPEVLIEQDGLLQGEVGLSTLVRSANQTELRTLTQPVSTRTYTENPSGTLDFLTKHPNGKLVVLDTDGSVIGIIYSEDVLDEIGSAPASSLFTFAGVQASERPFDTTSAKVRHRYRWLILNLATAFLAASVIAYFEDTLATIVILAMYMPIIAGMGSNAATQTLAVIVRGIAIGEISLANSRPALVREVQAGLINGLITGSIVFVVALIFNANALLGVVAGLSVVASLVIAAVAGTLIPLILQKMGKDPATSATIFITTGIDVFGFLIFFGLATLLLL